jgi:hypothetical protein
MMNASELMRILREEFGLIHEEHPDKENITGLEDDNMGWSVITCRVTLPLSMQLLTFLDTTGWKYKVLDECWLVMVNDGF